MDLPMILELISSVGFPIALVIAMAFFILRVYNHSVAREESLITEIRQTRDINAKALETLAHYTEKLETIQADISEIKVDLTKLTAK